MTTKISKHRVCIAAAALWLAMAYIPSVHARYDAEYMEARSVRVVAKSAARTYASSGFLWQNREQVITSLHAVPGGSEISVECRGVRKRATVLKTLPKADLILLHVSGLPDICTPFMTMEKTKPEPYSILYTFGYHAGARSGTSRRFEKGYANPERLDTLITGAPLQAIKEFGMPAADLDIYYVQGGLLPGYSGGPVVNENKQLIGIVDGGLNKGASSYNWVIPAKYLDELIKSDSSSIPLQVAQSSAQYFSTGMDYVDDASVVEYEQDGVKYTWVHTKTQTLAELAKTADDAEEIGDLFDETGSFIGVETRDQLAFDIYEELSLGLVIAVPKGQPFKTELIEDGREWLASDSPITEGGFTGIRYSYDGWEVNNDLQELISPSDSRYFDYLIPEVMLTCYIPGERYCELFRDEIRSIDFANGNKILRFLTLHFDADSNPLALDYYSFAVRGEKAFGAVAEIVPEGEVGLFQCVEANSPACKNTNIARNQLSQFLAASLTSFSDLSVNSTTETILHDLKYEYDQGPEGALFVEYYDGDELRFFNARGREWRIYIEDDYEIGTESDRDESATEGGKYVLVDSVEEFRFLIPVKGGKYFASQSGGDWQEVGTLQRRFTLPILNSLNESED